MPRKVVFLVVAVLVVAAAGVGLLASAKSPPQEAGPAADAPSDRVSAPAGPDPAAVPTIDAALRELDLIKPSREKGAEDFTLPAPGGTTFRLADQRGKVVLINFWATWCPPCLEEMPAMERLWLKHKDTAFVLVAVSVDTDQAKAAAFVADKKFTFPVAYDSKMVVAEKYGVRALPSSFIVDKRGTLAAMALGPRAWDNRASHRLVEAMAR